MGCTHGIGSKSPLLEKNNTAFIRSDFTAERRAHRDPYFVRLLVLSQQSDQENASTLLRSSGPSYADVQEVMQTAQGLAKSMVSAEASGHVVVCLGAMGEPTMVKHVSAELRPTGPLVFELNGQRIEIPSDGLDLSLTLNDFLRSRPGTRGTKLVCGQGGCGACGVVLSRSAATGEEECQGGSAGNGKQTFIAVNSCLKPLASLHGWSVTTIEGLGTACKLSGKVHPIQSRIARFNASQCGYCTPGFIASLYAQLHPEGGGKTTTPEKLAGSLDGHICRCTGYRPILDVASSFTPAGAQDIEEIGRCLKQLEVEGEGTLGPYDVCTYDGNNGSKDAALADLPVPVKGEPLVLQGRDGRIWCQPQTVEQVWRVLGAYPKARVINGNTGSGIYEDEKLGASTQSVIVSLQDVEEMHGCSMQDGHLVLGAGTTLSELLAVVEKLPVDNVPAAVTGPLLVHLKRVAGTLIRNTGTIGGNLQLAASKHFDSDLATLFSGLDAVVTVVRQSAKGPLTAEEDLVKFLQAGEAFEEGNEPFPLLVRLRFPLSVATSGHQVEVFRSYRVSQRRNNSHAYANACFRGVVDSTTGRVVRATMVLGALGATATRAKAAEAALLQAQHLDEQALEATLVAARKEIAPSHKTRFRWRLELVSSFIYKFFLALRSDAKLPDLELDPRLASAAAPMAERPLIKTEQLYSKRWGEESVTHTPLSKDWRGTQATGEAVYVTDVPEVEGTLHAAYVKSPRSAGTLAAIKADKAREVAGVVAVLTAADIPGPNDSAYYFGPPDTVPDQVFVPIGGRVQFHSQPVALVLALSAAVAQRAAKLVEVDFDGFDVPVVTIEDAREAKAIMGLSDSVKRGDAAAVIEKVKAAGADGKLRVVEGVVHSGGQRHLYLEPQTAYVLPDEERLVVYTGTQAPMGAQEIVARVLGIPRNAVQVRMRRTGGGFGGKATRSLPHVAAAAVAAKVLNRPVRLTLDRDTDMQLTGGRHEMEAEYTVAFDSESGRLEALDIKIWLNAGFCYDLSFTEVHDMTANLEQAYYIPNLSADTQTLRTNLPTSTTMRAPGVVQASFIIESVIDHVAAVVGRRAEQVREANFFNESDDGQCMVSAGCYHVPAKPVSHFTLPKIWESLRASAALDNRVADVEAFNQANRWRKRGVAMTPVKFLSPLMPMAATVNIYADGSVLIHHGGCEIGQGIHSKSALVALEVLSTITPDDPLTLDMISFADVNTDVIPNGGYTAGSTTSERACAAVYAACTELVKRLQPVKEKLLAKRSKDVEEGGPENGRQDPKPLLWRDVVSTSQSFQNMVDLSSHAYYRPETLHYHNYGAAVSEVEVDVLTGEVDIRASHLLYDCGKSINPAADIGQVEGAFTQGLGFYLTEESMIGSDGVLISTNTWEYKPPLWTDLPRDWRVELLENGSFDKGFLSSKASGEPPLILSTSLIMALRGAVAAARADAKLCPAGFRLDAPATPERLHRACGTHMGLMSLDPSAEPWMDGNAHKQVVEVAVAGAGLGGLAVGIALKKAGLDVHLYERAPALRDVSQGLVGITPNGIRALELIDPRLKEYLWERGKYNTEAWTKTIDPQGNESERIVTFQANNLSIPWADIQHSLARLVPKEIIHCSHDYVGFDEDNEGVTVYFRGTTDTVRAKLLVGVDGLFSVVRKAVAPFHETGGDDVCESGHTNWNAIMSPADAGLPYPHPVVSLTYQKQDPQRFFFIIECGHGRVLWQVRVDDPPKQYTVASKKGHGRLGFPGVKARVMELVEDIPDVRPYIAATPEETIYERCLLFRKMLQRYSTPGRRVVLVGDAAHGMHSVRGQGANQTFEDAHCLGLALEKKGVTTAAIRAYEQARIPRANAVQWESNTYYKRQFEQNTSHEWKLKFLNVQKYVMTYEPEKALL